MYKIKEKIKFNNQIKTAEEIGIAPETLSRILNKKQGCSKMTAYCITKAFDKNKEIKELFIRTE